MLVFMQVTTYLKLNSSEWANKESNTGKTPIKHQLGEYQQQGFVFPFPVFSDTETAAFPEETERAGKAPGVGDYQLASTKSLTCSQPC